MEKIKIKKELWKKLKKELLQKVPKKYKISIEDLDEDNEYAHPIINLDENFYLRGQIGGGHDEIYGWHVHIKNKEYLQKLNIYSGFDVDNDKNFNFVVNNFDKIKDRLNDIYEQLKSLNKMIELLQNTATDMLYSAINEEYEKDKIKKAVDNLYKVTEFLENNRLVD